MTRTPDEIYDEIRATPLPASSPSTLAERLAYAESHVVHYQRMQELWDELSSALIDDWSKPRWGFSAALGASGYAYEQKTRCEAIAARYREMLASEKVAT